MSGGESDVQALALLGEPTRRSLYDWVSGQPEAVGRDEAATALGINRGLAAFHLDKLVEAGLLEADYRRLTGRTGPGAGRPAKVYRRSNRQLDLSLPSRRYGLAAEIFARALEQPGGGATGISDVAHDTGAELGRSLARAADGEAGMFRALAAGGYEPTMTDDRTIRLRNCPFHDLAEAHRDLTCGMNLALTQGLVEGVGEAAYRPVMDPRPGWCCVALLPTD